MREKFLIVKIGSSEILLKTDLSSQQSAHHLDFTRADGFEEL